MTFFKKISWWLFSLVLLGITFAADPSYNFLPASGTELKMHCNYNGNLYLKAGGQNYNAFESTINFDSTNLQINHVSINSPFTQNQGNVFSGDLYRTYGALPGWQKSSTNVNAITFWFKTLTNTSSSVLSFTDRLGDPIIFGAATTDDWATLNGFDVNGADILTAVYDASYTFVPLPCIPDTNNPLISNFVPSNGQRYVPSNQVVSFLTYDWAGPGNVSGPSPLATNNRSHYWYQGTSPLNIANYVDAPDTVDNQEGVNSGSIKVTVSCPTCVGSWSYVLSWSDLTISDWAGDGSRNQWTWDSQRRGYDVSFDAPASYEIEKQVTVSLESVDNPNELWAVHTGTTSFSFNAPIAPIISRIYPITDTFVSPNKSNPIRLYISDDWAGIDTWTLSITIPAIMSWAEQLLTGYTYSWSDFIFTLSWGSEWLGNSGKYSVDFYPQWDFPANETVLITWLVSDLAGNQWSFTTSFTTRPDCSFFGCSEILNINILEWINVWSFDFTGTILVVTGTNPNSPYPYLTWVNNDTLVCWYPWTGAILTGNISIYDQSWTMLNGSEYTGKSLYITGLNFTVVDGVIIVQ